MGKCRICGCTEERACRDRCSWVEQDLCSTCAEAVAALVMYADTVYRFHPRRLMEEAQKQYHDEALAR